MSETAIEKSRMLAIWLVTGLALLTALDCFGQSYRGLYDWAAHHAAIPAPFSYVWPMMVDAPLVAGEVMLYIAATGPTPAHVRVWGWLMAVIGLAGSVAGNIGHVGWSASWPVKVSAPVPPLVAALMLASALILLKHAIARPAPATEPAKTAKPLATIARKPASDMRSPRETAPNDVAAFWHNSDFPPKPVKPATGRRRKDWLADPEIVAVLDDMRDRQAKGLDLGTDRKEAARYKITRARAAVLLKMAGNETDPEPEPAGAS